MRRRAGWTLLEVLIVVAVLGLLAAVLMPSFTAARQRARLAGCSAAMRDIHSALMAYCCTSGQRLPPFAFSDFVGSLPASGHWGGISQSSDPVAFGRVGFENLNLWALVAEGFIPPARLICPGAAAELRSGLASYFPHTFHFSTHCLRFPASEDLFRSAPGLANFKDAGLLGVYRMHVGGQRVWVDKATSTWTVPHWEVVPQVRIDKAYRTLDGSGRYDVLDGALLSDAFWWQGRSEEGAASSGLQTYPVRAGWCHGRYFNVLYGDGAVLTVRDDGTVEANSVAPGEAPPSDKLYHAANSERVWQFFDAAKRRN